MKILNPINCQVGEGPIWDAKTESFWQVDIRGKCLYRLKKGSWEKFDLPQKVGCMALSESGRVLVGMEDGVYWLDTMELAHQPITLKGERFNDGKVGPDGAFYLGTVGANGSGAFYRLADGKLTEIFDGCYCSNGLDWTADEKTMVYADSLFYKVELFDFDKATGTLSNRRTLRQFPEEWGKPDGLTVDANDHILLAFWDGHGILHLDGKTGETIQKIETPCPKASCCAFGGEDFKTLFITTAAMDDVPAYPDAGKTFTLEMPVGGKSIYYYKE